MFCVVCQKDLEKEIVFVHIYEGLGVKRIEGTC